MVGINSNLEPFIDYLVQRNNASKTIQAYTRYVKDFILYYQLTYDNMLKNFSERKVQDYLLSLDGKYKYNTVLNAYGALKAFESFLIWNGYLKERVTKGVSIRAKVEVSRKYNCSMFDVKQFILKVSKSGNLRNYAIVILMLKSGVRVGELVNIKLEDVDFDNQTMDVQSRKLLGYAKNNERRVPLYSEVIKILKAYLDDRKSNSQYLFSNRQGEKLSTSVVNRLFNKYSSCITPMTLRKFYVISCWESGIEADSIGKIVGISNITYVPRSPRVRACDSINSSLKYIKVDREDLQKLSDKLKSVCSK